jgi:hypothetical protein
LPVLLAQLIRPGAGSECCACGQAQNKKQRGRV